MHVEFLEVMQLSLSGEAQLIWVSVAKDNIWIVEGDNSFPIKIIKGIFLHKEATYINLARYTIWNS